MTTDHAPERSPWAGFVDALRLAGERLDATTAGLDELERADGQRALIRALNNQLGRFEVDRERAELVPFNEWRQKMLMDNPDCAYWVADIREGRTYRISGTIGDAVYLSITAYASGGTLDASASSRLDSDALTIGGDGSFSVVLSPTPPDGGGDWLALPAGVSSVWVRQFHVDARHERRGGCRIEPLDDVDPPPPIDPDRFRHHLDRLSRSMAALPRMFAKSIEHDVANPNEVRHWSEMTGGAAFTEPGIHYLRGSWQLGPDEALVIEGPVVPCRYWSVLLYSRFLNSLDHRSRRVSRTSGTARLIDGRYRFAIAAEDPGGAVDWLDSEGRPFGLFVFRFLQPAASPDLPSVRVCRITDIGATA